MEETDAYKDAERRLVTVGRKRTKAQERLDALEAELRQAIVDAAAAGVPKRAIGRLAGVVRQTVYNVLARDAG